MGALIRAKDWSATSLGPVATWPAEIKAVVDLTLASPIVASVAFGVERLLIYNEIAARLYGERHPDALGRPLAEAFTDSYPAVAPFYDRVFAGESIVVQGQKLAVGADGGGEVFDACLTPVRAADGTIIGVHMMGNEIGARALAEARLRDSEEQLHSLIAGIPQLVWRARAAADWTWASPQWFDFTGQPEAASHGRGWLDMVHPDDRDVALECWSKAEQRGKFEVDYRIYHAATGRYRWFQTRATPVRDGARAIVEWLGTSTDIEDLRGLQDRQKLLLAELQHRVRNILAMTRSVARRTIETASDVEDYVSHLEGRLSAMARTQAILTRSPGQGVDIQELILDELQAQAAREDQYRCRGPEVGLSPKAAEVVTLAIHELSTNATKYGAFSIPQGRVDVRWRTEQRGAESWLSLSWAESGLDLDGSSIRSGFGTELVTRRVPYELAGEGEIEMRPQGIRASIRFPLTEIGSILQTDADVLEATG